MSRETLPSLHDHFLVSYEVHCEARQIKLRCRRATDGAERQLREIVFMGVEAYQFENDAFGNIISSLKAVPVEELISMHGKQITESYQLSGAPGPWAADLVAAAKALSARGVQGFILSASYGLSGWVIASAGVVARQTGIPQHPH